jgi:hypothetical protein
MEDIILIFNEFGNRSGHAPNGVLKDVRRGWRYMVTESNYTDQIEPEH